MAFLQTSRWLGLGGRHAGEEFPEERPSKRLRTSQGHASILQPISRLVRDPFDQISSLAESLGYGIRESSNLPPAEAERGLQRLRLQGAKTHEEWRLAACELDRLEGNEEWKQVDESSEYSAQTVRTRLARLQHARQHGDLQDMRFQIRTSLTRDVGGMGNVGLYKHSHVGTKALIENYIETVVDVLDTVVDASGHGPSAGLDARTTLEQMKCARQAFGRSALLLSGGGTLGMNHIGVVKALFEANLLPRIISGASAGSIVCAVLCSRIDEEIPEVLQQFCHGALDVFEDEKHPDGILGKGTRLLTQGAIYDVDNLVRVMKGLLGEVTFLEAYNRTQRILSICVSSAELYELPRLLNYITAPHVMIWSAVAASCSVPLVFSPAKLMTKDPRTGAPKPWDDSPGKWIDGSVDNDLPMTKLAAMLNVNHFIVSQVNPHVVPFLVKEEDEIDVQPSSSALAPGPSWLSTLANLAKGEALHRMHVLAELGIFPNAMTKLRSVLGQRYAGDITIMPKTSYTQFPHILCNPTPEFMARAMFNGERATWPKLSRIRNHLAVELALDSAVRKLIARLAFSPSQVDLRMNAFARPTTTRSERGRSRRHKSSRSAIQRQRAPPAIKLPLDAPLPASPTVSQKVPGPAEYISSTDDTSQRSTSPTPLSDNGNDDDDPSEGSFDSPPDPRPANAFASARGVASVPATPSIASRTNFLGHSPSCTRAPTPSPRSPVPSSPEARYKRLFHTVRPMPTIRSQTATPDLDERKPAQAFDKHDVRLDTARPRRSLSTGIQGLKPPDRR